MLAQLIAFIDSVNDALIVTAPVQLGAIDEDRSILITPEQLLKNSFDVDGDKLSISELNFLAKEMVFLNQK